MVKRPGKKTKVSLEERAEALYSGLKNDRESLVPKGRQLNPLAAKLASSLGSNCRLEGVMQAFPRPGGKGRVMIHMELVIGGRNVFLTGGVEILSEEGFRDALSAALYVEIHLLRKQLVDITASKSSAEQSINFFTKIRDSL